jgi:hypothetical protein
MCTGGFTVDAATREEVLVVMQANDTGLLTLHNTDKEFPITEVPGQ